MKKVFIDCGANTGQGLRQFIKIFNINEEWEIHSYEPTPDLFLDDDLLNLKNLSFHKKAVWSKNGKINFSLCVPTEDWEEDSQGSSVIGLLDQEECVDPNSHQFRKNNNIVEVDAVDIVTILKKYSYDDYIVVKLDVEGSEYEICRRLLDSEEIIKIKELYVEWHTRMMSSETSQSENELKTLIGNYGVNLHDWY